jgi:hypothetical protein
MLGCSGDISLQRGCLWDQLELLVHVAIQAHVDLKCMGLI